jgi:hypothetical protein
MPPMVTTESQSVEVDEWVIGGESIEFNLNIPGSSSDSCTLCADGDDEEDGICEFDRGEVKLFRSCGGEYGGWGPNPRFSSEREGDKNEDAHWGASVIGSRGV